MLKNLESQFFSALPIGAETPQPRTAYTLGMRKSLKFKVQKTPEETELDKVYARLTGMQEDAGEANEDQREARKRQLQVRRRFLFSPLLLTRVCRRGFRRRRSGRSS